MSSVGEDYESEDGLARVLQAAVGDPEFPQYGYGMTLAALKKIGGLPDPATTLQPREIEQVVDFLLVKVVGKGPMDRAACIEYFGSDVQACKDLE